MALELRMDVCDDGQSPENSNLETTDEGGVRSDTSPGTEKAKQLTIDQ